MELIERTIREVRTFMGELPGRRVQMPSVPWPKGGPRNIVLTEDVGLELGNPRDESVACVLWTENISAVNDSSLTLIGPDFPESAGKSLPFGKVVLAGVEGFNEDTIYERCMELDHLRFNVDLEGFMLKAASQYQREWCRISKEAIRRGFSSAHLGSALMQELKTMPYVLSVETVFLTTSPQDVRKLREIVNPAVRLVAAMDKMAGELEYDCESCEFEDVCDEAEGLQGMRERAKKKAGEKGESVRG
jgi:CO dehydrogenase/acetyl-CoA synthase beta subunit